MTSRPPWRQTFSSLKVPNFRLYVGGQVVATTAMGMQRVTQDWLVLQLSGSVTAVGITVALQFAPMLLFGLIGGVVADRYSKRRLLIATQATSAAIAATLAVLILTGHVAVWHIWALAFLGGLVTVVDSPARQVFVNEVVGPRNLRNAISVNSSTFQFGSLVGPAIGGIAISAIGSGWSFAINSAACLVVVGALCAMRRSELRTVPPMPRRRGQLTEGLRYATGKPAILFTLIVLGATAMFAYTMPVILSAYADDVFAVGASGYGAFNALVAVGALAGAIASARRLQVRLRTVILGAVALGAVQLSAGLAPGIGAFGVLIVGSGFSSLMFLTAANSLVQSSSNLGIRGRVMALYVLVQLGGQSIGGPIMGAIVEHLGAHTGMVISGLVPLAVAAVAAVILARRFGLRPKFGHRRFVPTIAIAPSRRRGERPTC